MHGLYFPYPSIVKKTRPQVKITRLPLNFVSYAALRLQLKQDQQKNMSSPSPDGGIFIRETNIPTEKTTVQVTQNPDECYNIYDEGHGDLQVFTVADATDVKLARDGKTVLIPQPSDDLDDVLNWTTGKKYRVLSSLIFASMVWSRRMLCCLDLADK
jgi:hypothetical protein